MRRWYPTLCQAGSNASSRSGRSRGPHSCSGRFCRTARNRPSAHSPRTRRSRSFTREPADTAGGPDERRPRNIAPFLSNGRALWIGYSFTEEKAHRFALHNASQCDRRIVTYCQPALSQHHRCNRPNVQVVSLPKLLELASPETRRSYMPHARFLLNNLIDAAVALPSASVEELAGRIPLSAGAKMPIHTSAVRRLALGLLRQDKTNKRGLKNKRLAANRPPPRGSWVGAIPVGRAAAGGSGRTRPAGHPLGHRREQPPGRLRRAVEGVTEHHQHEHRNRTLVNETTPGELPGVIR